MSEGTARLRVRLGAAEVEYEGDTQFLKDEVMPTIGKIIKMVDGHSELQKPNPVLQLKANPAAEAPAVGKTAPVPEGSADKLNGSLSSLLKATGGDNNQMRRFLATAVWLRRRGHDGDLTSSIVAKTLQENHQKKLANPADCLNKNVSKGYCEKTKSGFFVTEEGKTSLGLHQ